MVSSDGWIVDRWIEAPHDAHALPIVEGRPQTPPHTTNGQMKHWSPLAYRPNELEDVQAARGRVAAVSVVVRLCTFTIAYRLAAKQTGQQPPFTCHHSLATGGHGPHSSRVWVKISFLECGEICRLEGLFWVVLFVLSDVFAVGGVGLFEGFTWVP